MFLQTVFAEKKHASTNEAYNSVLSLCQSNHTKWTTKPKIRASSFAHRNWEHSRQTFCALSKTVAYSGLQHTAACFRSCFMRHCHESMVWTGHHLWWYQNRFTSHCITTWGLDDLLRGHLRSLGTCEYVRREYWTKFHSSRVSELVVWQPCKLYSNLREIQMVRSSSKNEREFISHLPGSNYETEK